MRSKKLSVAVALSWFALVGVWYVFSAMHFFHYESILEPLRQIDVIVSVCWLTIPPLFWWIPRKLLIRNGKWHRVGTIVFCICGVLVYPCLLAFTHIETIYKAVIINFSTGFLGMLNAGMLFMELLFLGFKKEPSKSVANIEEGTS